MPVQAGWLSGNSTEPELEKPALPTHTRIRAMSGWPLLATMALMQGLYAGKKRPRNPDLGGVAGR